MQCNVGSNPILGNSFQVFATNGRTICILFSVCEKISSKSYYIWFKRHRLTWVWAQRTTVLDPCFTSYSVAYYANKTCLANGNDVISAQGMLGNGQRKLPRTRLGACSSNGSQCVRLRVLTLRTGGLCFRSLFLL